MTATLKSWKVGRVVVGLKSTSDADTSVSAAITVAAAIEAEVLGLFVQEDAMIDLAGLPFAQALGSAGTRPTSLTSETMTRALAARANICRQALSARADKARVRWSFTSEKGELPSRLRAMLIGGDFLVLAGENRGGQQVQPVQELRSAPAGVAGLVVTAWHRAKRSRGPIVAIDDGDPAGEMTVLFAARMAKVTGNKLHLFAIAAADAEVDRIVQRAKDLVGSSGQFNLHRLVPGAPQSIAAALMHIVPYFVVADLEGEPFQNDDAAISIFRAAQCPVVLLRPDADDVPR